MRRLNFPKSMRVSAAIHHLPTTAGAKQPYPVSADETIEAFLVTLDRQAFVLEGGDFVDPYELYVDVGADVRETDKVVIDSVTYFIKKVTNFSQGTNIQYQRCNLSTETT